MVTFKDVEGVWVNNFNFRVELKENKCFISDSSFEYTIKEEEITLVVHGTEHKGEIKLNESTPEENQILWSDGDVWKPFVDADMESTDASEFDERFNRLWRMVDSKKQGFVDLKRYTVTVNSALNRIFFEMLDTNRDDKLDRGEFRRMFIEGRHHRTDKVDEIIEAMEAETSFYKLFKYMDKDGSGEINFKQFAAKNNLDLDIESYDKDGNGLINKSEFRSMFYHTDGLPQRLDKDRIDDFHYNIRVLEFGNLFYNLWSHLYPNEQQKINIDDYLEGGQWELAGKAPGLLQVMNKKNKPGEKEQPGEKSDKTKNSETSTGTELTKSELRDLFKKSDGRMDIKKIGSIVEYLDELHFYVDNVMEHCHDDELYTMKPPPPPIQPEIESEEDMIIKDVEELKDETVSTPLYQVKIDEHNGKTYLSEDENTGLFIDKVPPSHTIDGENALDKQGETEEETSPEGGESSGRRNSTKNIKIDEKNQEPEEGGCKCLVM